MEEVRGEINGKAYKGLVYSALNKKDEKVGNSFKSSLFEKSVGMAALEKHIEQSAEIIKSRGLKERSKKVIAAAMRNNTSRAGFEKTLERQGISAVFRSNDEGRIYGATFIEHGQKCVFNGSRLGKEFSANVFNDLFNGAGNKPDKEQTFAPFEKSHGQDEGSGGIFDLFSPDLSGDGADNAEEQALTRRMKKKQKRQRRM